MPIAAAQSPICSAVISYENAVWCAPPAKIQASAPVYKSGCGVQKFVATGSFGIGFSFFLQSTVLIISRKRLPRSIRETAMPLPSLDVKTSLAGSSRFPMDNGWHLMLTAPSAIDGQISSI